MPYKPIVSTLAANSVGIMNTIRDNASPDYQQAVPAAAETTESIRNVGAQILSYEPRKNEFISALVNRIALVLITSKAYSNPWSMFKRGFMELGETVEEVFVNIADPAHYDPDDAEETLYKRQRPDVKTMFHAMNLQNFYKVTISDEQLRQAFLSFQGVSDLVTKIVNSLYSAMAFDEFTMMKYLLAIMILKGNVKTVTISDPAVADNANAVVTSIKTVSNAFEFMSKDYNIAGVKNFCSKEEQYLIQSSAFSANVDVNSLAKAFNLDYVKFAGKQILVDSFGTFDTDRLALLLAGDTGYTAFTSTELALLNSVGAILVDRDFFMIFDHLQEAREIINPQGLYRNEFLHVWKTFSASPFANAAAFTTTASTITSVAVSPATATVAAGANVQLVPVIVSTGFANLGVTWEIKTAVEAGTVINSAGLLTLGATEDAATITVRATSVFNPTKYGEATITLAGE